MRKALAKRTSAPDEDELRPEYHFDYSKSRPNRFARTAIQVVTTVVLDQDVASVFRTSKAVNTALRALLGALPTDRRSGTKRRRTNKRMQLPSGALPRRSQARR